MKILAKPDQDGEYCLAKISTGVWVFFNTPDLFTHTNERNFAAANPFHPDRPYEVISFGDSKRGFGYCSAALIKQGNNMFFLMGFAGSTVGGYQRDVRPAKSVKEIIQNPINPISRTSTCWVVDGKKIEAIGW